MKLAAFSLLLPAAALAQHPFRHFTDAVEVRHAATQPVVSYTLRVDPSDTAGFAMEMRVRNVPDTFRVAMAAHPEYDDRFWRFMGALRAESRGGTVSVVRTDSSIWRVVGAGGEVTLRWRVGVPFESRPRASWRPFIAPTGALVGGAHSFLYVLGAELAPAQVLVDVPHDWTIATGLTPTSDRHRYFAPSVDALVDSPIMVGRLRDWSFAIDDVPHRVVYWPSPNAAPFDTAAFVRHVEGIAREAIALFGRAPYREFVYMFEDDSYGGLEHLNSVTIGAPSEALASGGMAEVLADMAHEYVHAWNLVRIRPAERTGVSPRQTGRSYGLWFSEGLTMYYADALARRAGAPVNDSARVRHLERVLSAYLNNPGNTAISPERASWAEYGGQPGQLGDYDPSPHNQGEIIGTMLDLLIRERTRDARSMDDVMRLMMRRYSADSGFTGRGVERAVADVCGCTVRTFFDRFVRAAGEIPVDDYLRAIGLRARLARVPQTEPQGEPSRDLRLLAWNPTPSDTLRVLITNPANAWARAGIHTNDRLIAFNGQQVAQWRDLRAMLTQLRMGDTARVTIRRGARTLTVPVPVTGFERTQVQLEERPGATEAQRLRRARWMAGR
ncbi:MAG TPA: PDZ domain-containing protein [Gemmatimonadaceae bacterium]|nr:PDZ domain-containing protein [Gemmatimonadaceae bacterium]